MPQLRRVGEPRARADGDDAGGRTGLGARLRPDLDVLSNLESGQPLLGDFDAKVGRLELQRDDGLARGDPLALTVVAGQNGPALGRDERSFLLEAAHLSEARPQRFLLRA